MADEELFNLDDFQDPEVSDNINNTSPVKVDQDNGNKIPEEKNKEEEHKEESTKTNSDKPEIIPLENPSKKIEITKFNDKTEEKEKKEEKKR